LPSALFARPRFFNDCSEKDTVRLLMSRPVALICSAISAAERAPRRPRTSAIAEPMVWRASAWLLASGLRFGFGFGFWPRRRSLRRVFRNCRRDDILAHAYAQCRSNKGAPGGDGQDFADIEAYQAPPRPATPYGWRNGQSARRARDLSRLQPLSHSWVERAGHHRGRRVVGLHSDDQPAALCTASVTSRHPSTCSRL
jgi:hypothetical protein